MNFNMLDNCTLFFLQACERVESSKSCSLIGSENGQYFRILPANVGEICRFSLNFLLSLIAFNFQSWINNTNYFPAVGYRRFHFFVHNLLLTSPSFIRIQ